MDPGGRDLGEGFEDEAALGHGGMRQGQFRGFEHQPIEPEQIEVDDAGAFGCNSLAPASHGVFESEQRAQEGKRFEVGLEQDRGVEEARLVEKVHGCCIQKGTYRLDLPEMGKPNDCLAEIIFARSESRG